MKNLLILTILILFANLTYAQLIISPTGYEGGTVYVNQEKLLALNITNTFNFTIYNINTTPIDLIDFPFINELAPNQTKQINITIKSDDIFETRTFNPIIKFWYYSEINLDPKTFEIKITDGNFTPSILTMTIGDKVQFNNTQTVFASVADDYSPYRYFDKQILPNQTVTIENLNQIDDFFYTDWNIYKKGKIIVQERTDELINNPEYNKIFPISFQSRYVGSQLGIELYPENNLTIEYNSFQEINARLWNEGNASLYNIKLKTSQFHNWFEFEENDFTLDPNQNRFIKIRVTPQINYTNQTNMTYSIDIIAESQNSQTTATNLKIFIPYTKEILRIYYGENFWQDKVLYWDTFCTAHPNILECNAPPKIETRFVEVPVNSTVELTKEDAVKNFRNINDRLSVMEGNDEKNTISLNQLIERLTSVETKVSAQTTLINESNQLSKESEKTAKDNFTTLLLQILFTVVLIGCGYAIFFFSRKKLRDNEKEVA